MKTAESNEVTTVIVVSIVLQSAVRCVRRRRRLSREAIRSVFEMRYAFDVVHHRYRPRNTSERPPRSRGLVALDGPPAAAAAAAASCCRPSDYRPGTTGAVAGGIVVPGADWLDGNCRARPSTPLCESIRSTSQNDADETEKGRNICLVRPEPRPQRRRRAPARPGPVE